MVKEKLLCYALLLNNCLISFEKYTDYLNTVFLENPNNTLLLELQFCTSNMRSTIRLILQECYEAKLEKDSFATILLQELKNVYFSRTLSIETFAKQVYSLWNSLPNSMSLEDPLHILSYADDPLSWDDIKQTCDIYEDLFEYYNEHAK